MITTAESYAAAHLPDRWRVLGQPLLPVTIGHGLVLARLGSPWTPFYPRPVELLTPRLGDLLAAIYVLAHPWEQSARRILTPSFRRWLRLWEIQIRLCCHRVSLLAAATDQLTQAIAQATREPVSWPPSGEKPTGRPPGSPTLATLKVALMAHLRLSAQAALDTPIEVALWDLAVWAESRGAVVLKSDHDNIAAAQLRALAAQPPAADPEPEPPSTEEPAP